MSSISLFKQETQTKEQPQVIANELASWWVPGDATDEKRLVLVLTKMARHVLEENTTPDDTEMTKSILEEDVIPDNGDCKQMSLFQIEDISASNIEGRGKGKRKMNKPKHKTSENPSKDAVVQLRMFN